MAIGDARVVLAITSLILVGLTLQLLGCVIWGSWWPLLTIFLYVLVPMPYLFFSSIGGGGGSETDNGWADCGKFLTGFAGSGCVAIPAILYHSGKIVLPALVMELVAFAVLLCAVLVYDHNSSADSGYYY